jgi:hypothetical protein
MLIHAMAVATVTTMVAQGFANGAKKKRRIQSTVSYVATLLITEDILDIYVVPLGAHMKTMKNQTNNT